MVEVTQEFNTSMVYKVLLQQANTTNIYDARMVLADARTNMDYVHIKFEILTELCDDFKKCENCKHSPCVDGKVMLELSDLFYDMEKHYFDMLEAGENFLERLNQEQERIKLMGTEKEIQSNTEKIIELYERQGLCDEADASKQELKSVKEQIRTLENSKLESAEMNRFIAKIQKEIDYINRFARPKFIRYCKVYIDMKKAHARELRETGHIQYNKVNE